VGPLASDMPNYGWAWMGLTLALAVHVTDEAVNDFLALYNPAVQAIRDQLPWLPLPVFTFRIWVAGLVTAVLLLLLLSRYAFANSRLLRPLGYAFAIIMLANGLLHIAASLYLWRLAPGVLSAPLLLAAATWLLISLHTSARPIHRHPRFAA
jgi:hypothetical protein